MKKIVTFIVFLTLAAFVNAQSDLIISEIVEGTGNNKAIEIFNPTSNAIDLSTYFITRYSNGATTYTSGGITQLSGTIQANSTFVLINGQITSTSTSPACDPALQGILISHGGTVNGMLDGAYPSPTYFNGNDAVALLKQVGNNKIPIDLFGQIGLLSVIENAYGWSNVDDSVINYTVTVINGTDTTYVETQSTIADYVVKLKSDDGQYYGPYWMCWTKDLSLVRKSYINQGVTTNPSPFIVSLQWEKLSENVDDWNNLGIHVLETPYSVFFNISDGANAISDAIITLNGSTNEAGNYTFNNVVAGTYNYSVYKYGYINYSGTTTITNSDVNIDVVLTQSPAYIVEFNISDGINTIPDAIITFNGITNSPGDYTFSNIFPGSFSFSVAKSGFNTFTGNLTVNNSNVNQDIVLVPDSYTVDFVITDGNNNLTNAVVTLDGVTNSAGDYTFYSILPGTYDYSILLSGYYTINGTVLVSNTDITENVIMEIVTYSVTFTISDGVDAINDAVIFFNGIFYATGEYFIDSLLPGEYSYSIIRSNYGTVSGDVSITDHDTIINVILTDVYDVDYSDIGIYPNPAEGELNVIGISSYKNYQIFNLTGEIIQDGIVLEKLELKYLEPGFYILKIVDKRIKFLKK